MGCFWGCPQLCFTVGSVVSVGFWGTSGVGKGASSSSNSAGAPSLSGLSGASSLSGLMSWVFLGQK